jgi:hypothetical protein
MKMIGLPLDIHFFPAQAKFARGVSQVKPAVSVWRIEREAFDDGAGLSENFQRKPG